MKFILLFLLQISFINSFSQDIHSGRVAYYPFSGDANDKAGNNHGVVHGPTLVKDRFGNPDNAFQFDGIQDFIEIPDNPVVNFDANEDFTISLWVNISENQADLNGHNNEILGKWNAYNHTGYPFAIRYWNRNASSSNKHTMFTMRYDSENCGNNPVVTGACSIFTDEWHHIVMRKQGSEIAYFQDGILSSTTQDNTHAGCGTRNSNPVFIGKRDRNLRYFTGAIDDISFYNRALTEEEINILLKENQWSPKEPSFSANFKSFYFPEQTGPAIIDSLNHTISVEVSCATKLSTLVANFTLPNGAYAVVDGVTQRSGETSNDFNKPLKYIVMRGDGCVEQEWIITVHREKVNSEAKFTSFILPEQTSPAEINLQERTIRIEVSCSSGLSSLTPRFTLSDGTYATVNEITQQSGVSANNFNEPVTYLLKDENNCFEQEWTVNVEYEEKTGNTLASFSSFTLPNQQEPTLFDSVNQNITILMPCETDFTNLSPHFSLEKGAIAEVAGKVQQSGITKNNFSAPIVYRILNQEACAQKEWTVYVKFNPIRLDAKILNSEKYFLPNVITPNNDELNDAFEVGHFFLGSEFSVFNRHGKRVFKSSSYQNEFFGYNLSPGVYFYTIKHQCLEKALNGYLILVKE